MINLNIAKQTYKAGVIITSASGNLKTKYRLTNSLRFGETNKNDIYSTVGNNVPLLIFDSETNQWAKIY